MTQEQIKKQISWTTEKRKVSDLIPYEKNPRKITKKQKEDLTRSIKKFNLVEIPAINTDGKIIAGHQRLIVLASLGRGGEEIDVRVPNRALTEEEFKEYCVRSNLNTGEWDFDILGKDFNTDSLIDWGFDLFKKEEEVKDDGFEVPENGIQTDIILGDLFEIGEHRLLCGDSTDSEQVAKLMNGEKADMVFTDPPYNVNAQSRSKKRGLDTIKNDNMFKEDFAGFMYLVFNNLYNFSKENIATYVWHNHKCQLIFEEKLLENNYEIKSQIIWVKDIPSYSNNIFRQQHEIAFYCVKKGYEILNENGKDSTIWNIPSVQSAKSYDEFGQSWFKGGSENLNLHVTQKPIQLPTKALNFNSNINDLVLDLFLGSGSTMVAAHQLKRKCYGMELEPKYVEVIVDRMRKLDPSLVIKRNGVVI